MKIMEVCGTHTMALFRHGIRDTLPADIKLVSGPGCPVCVTGNAYIDTAVRLGLEEQVIITTFGDMIRVPGLDGKSLQYARACGADIRIAYSPLNSLKIAAEHRNKTVLFLSVGFETTTPGIALTVEMARKEKLDNFFLLTANKTIPAAMSVLVGDGNNTGISGFLLPGHVCAVTGLNPLEMVLNGIAPGVVTGFGPGEMKRGLNRLIDAVNARETGVFNEYIPVVRPCGNPDALDIMYKVFEPCQAYWRGFGMIPGSGLALRDEYKEHDGAEKFGIDTDALENNSDISSNCMCGSVVTGRIEPPECPAFGNDCTPVNPVGPCMISREGSCAAWYRFARPEGS